MRGRDISLGEVSSFYVHFPILKWDFKVSKMFACAACIVKIHIFRFRMHARLQVDIDFNTESKFSFSRTGFFSPLRGHSKVIKPVKLLFFYPIGAFRGPPKPPSQYSQIILC